MRKPDAIPNDVWEMAVRLVGASANTDDERTLVSYAIMNERERCARIAEMHDPRGDTADAIRNGAHP